MTTKHIAQLSLAICLCLTLPATADVDLPQHVVVDGIWYPTTHSSGCGGTSTEPYHGPVTIHGGSPTQPDENIQIDSPVPQIAPPETNVEPATSKTMDATEDPEPISVLPGSPRDRSFNLAQPTRALTQVQTIEDSADEDFQVPGSFTQEPQAVATTEPKTEAEVPVDFDTEPSEELVETAMETEEDVATTESPSLGFAFNPPAETEAAEETPVVDDVERYTAKFVEEDTTHAYPLESEVVSTETDDVVETPIVREQSEETVAVETFATQETPDSPPVVETIADSQVATVAAKPAIAARPAIRTARTGSTKAKGLWGWWPLALLPLIGWGAWRLLGGRKEEETMTYAVYGDQSNVATATQRNENQTFNYTSGEEHHVVSATIPAAPSTYDNAGYYKSTTGGSDKVSPSRTASRSTEFPVDATQSTETRRREVANRDAGTDVPVYETETIASSSFRTGETQGFDQNRGESTAAATDRESQNERATNRSSRSDDLSQIQGLDQNGVELLNANGIHSFQQLRDAKASRLKKILRNAGPEYRSVDPGYLTRQAKFAASGNWDGLSQWQTANRSNLRAKPSTVTADAQQRDASTQQRDATTQQRDDLTRIRGLGASGVEVLNRSGIYTFEQLRNAGTPRLQEIFRNAGPQFSLLNPSDWVQQSEFASSSDWNGLAEWQTANPVMSEQTENQVTQTTPAAQGGHHDLTKISGIGPSTARFLRSRGISRFEQIAQMTASQLEDAMDQAGANFQLVDPTTWPQQAVDMLRAEGYDTDTLNLLGEVKELSAISFPTDRPVLNKQS